MRRFLKWLLGGLGVVVVLAVAVAAIGFAALRSTVPETSATQGLAGLAGTVRVVSDAHGIPHIEAANRADAVRVLGYLHARDRLWQMHVLRMVAQGRLSEMFGRPTIDTDIFLRTVDIANSAQASYEALSAEAKADLTAYAEGINAYMGRDTGLLETALPPEFLILGVTPEPWESWQSVAIIKVMALTLDSNLSDEITRFALAARGFAPREIDDLLPYDSKDNPPPLPDLRKIYEFRKRTKEQADASRDTPVNGLAWEIGITASNNWVVAGSRTVSGKPLLANDPHLGLTTPAVFYLAHMAFGEGGETRNVIGGTLPGTPLFLLGRNDRVGWGLTTTTLDSQDLYIERLNPDNANQYLTPDGWRDFETEEVEIAVSGEKPVTFTRRVSRHGPVLPENYSNLKDILPIGHVASLQWVSLARDDTTVDAARDIATANNVDDYFEAVRKIVAPMQSMVVADVDGKIGLIAPGRVPLRTWSNTIDGRAPVPGWLAQYDWTGWLPFEGLPRIVDPADGALATANGNWLPPDYRGHISYDWDEPYRQNRVEELVVGAKQPHSPATMKAIQADTYSPALVDFRDQAIAQLEQTASQDASLLEALRKWDGHVALDRPEPLIMTAWWRHFGEGLLKDDLGSDFSRFAKGNLEPVINILRGQASRDWCDDASTSQVESCGHILSVALAAAIEEVSALQGAEWTAWRWGAAHRAFGEHRPFSSVGPLARFFTVEPESAGGSYTLLRGRTDFREKHPYYSVHASAYRGWYDFSDLDKSQFVVSTGQSGHFLSPHYGDLAPVWASVDYVPMTTNRAEYEAGSEGIWTFNPGK